MFKVLLLLLLLLILKSTSTIIYSDTTMSIRTFTALLTPPPSLPLKPLLTFDDVGPLLLSRKKTRLLRDEEFMLIPSLFYYLLPFLYSSLV